MRPRALLRAGANGEIPDLFDITPVEMAQHSRHVDIAKLLVESGDRQELELHERLRVFRSRAGFGD